jgi:putative ABC transport system substrate-binding protein
MAARGARAAPERMRRIALLLPMARDNPVGLARIAALLQELHQLGWTMGRNIGGDVRWAGADVETIRKHAMELVALTPDVILAQGSVAVTPLLQATRNVSIVFVIVPDPVGAGLVESLAHPGGNATGFLQYEYVLSGKWIELLKQITPEVTRAAVIRDPATTAGVGQFSAIQSAAASVGMEVRAIGVRDAGEIERGITAFVLSTNGGLIVTGSASSKSDHHAGGPAQTSRGVLRTLLCDRRWPDFLRA